MKRMFLLAGLLCMGLLALPTDAVSRVEIVEPGITLTPEGNILFLGKELPHYSTWSEEGCSISGHAVGGGNISLTAIQCLKEDEPNLRKSRYLLIEKVRRNRKDQTMSAYSPYIDAYTRDEFMVFTLLRRVEVGKKVFYLEMKIMPEGMSAFDVPAEKVQEAAFQTLRDTPVKTIMEIFVEK